MKRTCLSIWFSFCKVESLSSSSEFFFSKSFTLISKSFKYAFFLSLACCADTLFLSNLLKKASKRHQIASTITQSAKTTRVLRTSSVSCFLCQPDFSLSSSDPPGTPESGPDRPPNRCPSRRPMFPPIHRLSPALSGSPHRSPYLGLTQISNNLLTIT